jgi:hypothetical protein
MRELGEPDIKNSYREITGKGLYDEDDDLEHFLISDTITTCRTSCEQWRGVIFSMRINKYHIMSIFEMDEAEACVICHKLND